MLDCAVTIQGFLYLGSCPVASCVSWATGRCLLWELVLARGANLSLELSCVLVDLPTSGLVLPPVFHISFFIFSFSMPSCLFFDHILSHFYFYFFHHSHPRLFSSVLVPVLFSLSQSSVYVYPATPILWQHPQDPEGRTSRTVLAQAFPWPSG